MLIYSSADIVSKAYVQNIMVCICKHVNKIFPHISKFQSQKYIKTKIE